MFKKLYGEVYFGDDALIFQILKLNVKLNYFIFFTTDCQSQAVKFPSDSLSI